MTTDAPAAFGSGPVPATGAGTAASSGAAPAERPGWSELFGPDLRALTIGLILLLGSNAFEIIGSATAMPAVLDDVGGVGAYGWAIAAPLVAAVLAAPFGGRLADRWGTLRPLVLALVLFATGLLAAAVAPSMQTVAPRPVPPGPRGGCVDEPPAGDHRPVRAAAATAPDARGDLHRVHRPRPGGAEPLRRRRRLGRVAMDLRRNHPGRGACAPCCSCPRSPDGHRSSGVSRPPLRRVGPGARCCSPPAWASAWWRGAPPICVGSWSPLSAWRSASSGPEPPCRRARGGPEPGLPAAIAVGLADRRSPTSRWSRSCRCCCAS